MGDTSTAVSDRNSTKDVIAERQRQIDGGWDEKNTGLNLDQYLGIAAAYTGRATASYRNDPSEKREMIMKAAAVLLQTLDRIDDGSLSTAIPMNIPARDASPKVG
jgi:hypothetical protein